MRPEGEEFYILVNYAFTLTGLVGDLLSVLSNLLYPGSSRELSPNEINKK